MLHPLDGGAWENEKLDGIGYVNRIVDNATYPPDHYLYTFYIRNANKLRREAYDG
jgi:hypothetical protein